jgi:putative flavoprotein involved in K+ transport
MDRTDVLVIGAGPAGLATSHHLSARGIEHLVLERGRVAQSWRDRWDSFCLVTPNWTVMLPGGEYDGPDPDGFLPRDDLVAHFERYAARSGTPLREGVSVERLTRGSRDEFRAETSSGAFEARQVVVTTSSFRKPHLPANADTLPASVLRIDSTGYRRPADLPPGDVLIVGSGQTGGQIAEELMLSGRRVALSCGKAPWMPRRVDDHDGVWWAYESGVLDEAPSALPSPRARFGANFLNTGARGGHDLSYRTLQALGVTLVGRFLGAEGTTASFAPDLAASVAWSDDRYRELRDAFRKFAAQRGLPSPSMPDPPRFDDSGVDRMDLSGFGAAIFTGGFRPDYESWIEWPDAFDDMGFPVQLDGSSRVVPGLHFVGVHFQRKRKSATLVGMGEDAGIVAQTIASSLGVRRPRTA